MYIRCTSTRLLSEQMADYLGSMLAQNFSLALDNAFGLDGTFELTQTVQDK
jgi:hypothetical protein